MFCHRIVKVDLHKLLSVHSKFTMSKNGLWPKPFLFTSGNRSEQRIMTFSFAPQRGICNVRHPPPISKRINGTQRKLTGITDKKIPQCHTIHVNEALVLESIPVNRKVTKSSQQPKQSFLKDAVAVIFSGSSKDNQVSGRVQLGKISIANYDQVSPQDVSLVPITIYEHCNCSSSIFNSTCRRIDHEFNNSPERSYELNVLAIPEGDQISINQGFTSFQPLNVNGISIKGLKFNIKIRLPNVEQDIEDYINEKKEKGGLKDFNHIDGIRMEFVANVSGITGIQMTCLNSFNTDRACLKDLKESFIKVLTNLVKEGIQKHLNNGYIK